MHIIKYEIRNVYFHLKIVLNMNCNNYMKRLGECADFEMYGTTCDPGKTYSVGTIDIYL